MKMLLIALDERIVNCVLRNTDWNIEVLIVPNEFIKSRFVKIGRIRNIITRKDFHDNEDFSCLDYKKIEKYWYVQLKSENFFNRFYVDYQLGKFDYYRGAALAFKIYKEYDIDLVLVDGFNEGRPSDMLIAEIARNKKIPCYNFEVSLADKSLLYDNIAEDIVPMNVEGGIDVKSSMFYHQEFNGVEKALIYQNPILKNKYIKKLESVVYRLGGEIAVDFFSCIYTFSNRKNQIGLTFSERVCRFINAKKVLSYVNKIAIMPNYKDKYVFFSLHFEQEATISGRGLIDSQLAALKMLSQALPKEWKIYVKEHPHQFSINTRQLYGYPVATFKTKRFYDEILKLENVIFVNTNIKSKELIEKAEAVATLSGTSIIEAITLKKPVIVFAPSRVFYKKIKDVNKVYSYEDCKKAMDLILGGFKPKYDDFEYVCNQYLFDCNYDGYSRAIGALKG